MKGSYISSSRLYSNLNKGVGVIYLINSCLNYISDLYENKDFAASSGITLNLSVLNLNTSSIYNQLGHTGSSIYAITDSSIHIYNSHFQDLTLNSRRISLLFK